ncbi:hypothetical protein MBM_00757 [Drepanopeziza brunnea f. sp. 'multigermtubi' MB_m1]|uniref:Uncharacterized protein n=1 Tax=Marssonina brunnea f. sp. multigermtubi (strain MB_m1) TaxID=1072389 RepID=K1Y949_MARBU|nr:uncharacterized protein MBM_00757 [Drepanopeziza brunnea f. sp. 'multigermtubi' MB_m1]EKD21644.1 hypothetical protein MBM_00757 [Drepanopeziza brunnea f. sp. 'multigermtubi' MB_m1]
MWRRYVCAKFNLESDQRFVVYPNAQKKLTGTPSKYPQGVMKMITDLVKTESEIRVKDISLSDKQRVIDQQSTEMEHLRASQGSAQHSTQLQRATIEQLTTEVREKDLLERERDQALRERDFEIRSTKSQLA